MRTRLAIIAACIALGACGQKAPEQTKTPTPEEMGQDDPSVPFKPAEVGKPSSYFASSKTAMALTGDITLTPTPQASPNLPEGLTITFSKGLTIKATLMPGGATQGSPAFDWFAVIPNLMFPDSIAMYSIDEETSAAGGEGLCPKTRFIATRVTTNPAGDYEDLNLYAINDEQWPPRKPDTAICATFLYSRKQ